MVFHIRKPRQKCRGFCCFLINLPKNLPNAIFDINKKTRNSLSCRQLNVCILAYVVVSTGLELSVVSCFNTQI